jgi:hypothetical protein
MKRRRPDEFPLCVFCQLRPGGTRDHVPPTGLFPEPKPSHLITVPCCAECQRRQGKDDEYFKTVIGMREDLAGYPPAAQIIQSTRRALERGAQTGVHVPGRGLALALLRGTRLVSRLTPAGLYLGKTPAFDVDLVRLARVVQRVTLGLWYHEFGVALPSSVNCEALAAAGMDLRDRDVREAFESLIDVVLTGRHRDLGPGILSVLVLSRADGPAVQPLAAPSLRAGNVRSVHGTNPPGRGGDPPPGAQVTAGANM